MTGPAKVAVIGGGCAALAAAFELTRPEQRGRFHVTVYQEGFRLGGKGASGRGAADRIEEHGLHLWMGFYENAFRLMRECYAELGRDPAKCRIADWRDAFVPAPWVGLAERDGCEWDVWKVLVPRMPGLPGDPPARQRWSVFDYFVRTVELLRGLLRTLPGAPRAGQAAAPTSQEQALGRMAELLRYGELATLTATIEALGLFEVVLGSLSKPPDNVVLRFFDAIARNARCQIEQLLQGDPGLRRVWQVIDIVLATLRGELRFGIFDDPRGFDALDDYDCREWLLLNGAAPSSLDSGFVRGLYDLVFAYEDGDPQRPRIAAGQALRSVVRAFFTYRGAFFWKMTSGMGDVVFAPLYEVLKRRGVRFEFFHRLRNVRIAERDGPHVQALEFDVQAQPRGGREYQPLIDVRGLPCWPSRPDYDQLVDGRRLEAEGWDFESHWDRRCVASRTLRVTEGFDFVVLGVGLGAIPHVCGEIVTRDARWRAMIDHVKTVPTQALQLWLAEDMKELGWEGPSGALSGFAKSFDTWADMGHLLGEESWPREPRALAYFCGVLPEADEAPASDGDDLPVREHERVRRHAVRFLEQEIGHLWPRAVGASGGFRWGLLADPAGPRGPAAPADESRLRSQYWRANVNPSDRYALSLPGSTAYRISPLDPSYDNLTLAGDWTLCGFNAGCVEAAVMSGRLAAHALSQWPPLEDITGFDHP